MTRRGLMATMLLLATAAGAGAPDTRPATTAPAAGRLLYAEFETRWLPPVYRPPTSRGGPYQVFQRMLQNFPEDLVVYAALQAGGSVLGIGPTDQQRLSKLLEDVYERIGEDPIFGKARSALPYCFAARRPTKGQYNLYVPAGATPDSPTVVFLHGAGGNYVYYTYLLARRLGGAIVMAPSWGQNWKDGPAQYLTDMLADAEKRLGFRPSRPWLMAISYGGLAGFRIYGQNPEAFRGYVSIASMPHRRDRSRLRGELNILMLNAKADSEFAIEPIRACAQDLAQAVKGFRFVEVEGDHYFLLTDTKRCFEEIRRFMGK